LKQILDTPYFGQISTQNRLRILGAYWDGIASRGAERVLLARVRTALPDVEVE
jgi:hypothetical protein